MRAAAFVRWTLAIIAALGGEVYVSNAGNSTQTVIDGATLATTTLPTSGNGRIRSPPTRGRRYRTT